ncbi:Thioredoxin [Limihaloglobus sulfuriphilus]|uniref:Thioredoxin n=1 Tax=Limihaloglobus sulfuriphilus TaxID=1851148 RepID=A0A1Q2MGL0_9BACT|nr:thioredoxin [Limihaloglobus sulfuriphilus]AQQ71789.1 Thioredoxin [Limihaloglobus sulfuriphilus]
MSDLVIEANSDNFGKIIEQGISLVDFWAPWCGPCKMQVPILEELAAETRDEARILKVNVDEAEDVAMKYGIQAIPTLILFKDGREVRRFVGVQSGESLANAITAQS